MKNSEIALTIQWDRLVAIADEMFLALIRTAFSTIVREAFDLCCAVFDRQGLLLSQATYCAPAFVGTLSLSLPHFLRYFPIESMRPGDVFITNDPWMGTGHIFDITVVRPVFRGEEIVAFTGTITHVPDIGGLGFSAAAQEVYEEGLRIPPMKLAEGGRLNETLISLVRANNRVPEQTIGDIHANIASNEKGAQQILQLMQEYNLNSLDVLSEAIRTRTENALRQEIKQIPDGSYYHEFQIEGFHTGITVACTVKIHNDEVIIDFDGTGPTVAAGVNVPLCYTSAYSTYAMKCITTPSIPNNDGILRPITVTAPEGCLLNAQHPAATGARHAIGQFAPFGIWGALASVLPERLAGEMGMMNLFNFVGYNLRGERFSNICFSAGGFGARATKDGLHTTMGPANTAVASVEALESSTDILIDRKELRQDSGGPGLFRGGLGQWMEFRNRSDTPITVACFANRTSFPPMGYQGGKAGALRRVLIGGESIHPKGRHLLHPGEQLLRPGETLTSLDAGSGGFGDPFQRSVDAVVKDVAEGIVSIKSALDEYGVVIDTTTGQGHRIRTNPKDQ